MSRIKTKDSVVEIREMDKSAIASAHMKKALIRTKDSAAKLQDDRQGSPSEYAEEQVKYTAEGIAVDAAAIPRNAYELGKRQYVKRQETKQQEARATEIQEEVAISQETVDAEASAYSRQRYSSQSGNRDIKTRDKPDKTIRERERNAGVEIKTKDAVVSNRTKSEKTIKTVTASPKEAVQASQISAAGQTKAIAAERKREDQIRISMAKAKDAAEKAAQSLKKLIQEAMEAIRNLILTLEAGGSVVAVLAVLFCLIGLIVGSSYGIFFSNEDADNSQKMKDVIHEINAEYQGRIDGIKAQNEYDEVALRGSRASWQDVLSIYAILTTADSANGQEVVTINPEKKQLIKNLFWRMTSFSTSTETETETEIVESDDGNGNILEEEVITETVTLVITVHKRTAAEMAAEYGFSESQLELLDELLSPDNAALWRSLLGRIYTSVVVDEGEIWAVLLEFIGNPYGVAGLMGNLYAESGLNPMNLEGTFEESLGYTDESYTEAVDSGAYTRFGYDSAGYGLAQWTSNGRKQGLQAFAIEHGTSISDLGMQLDYLCLELETSYAHVLTVLQNAGSVREASDYVLHYFEAPLVQDEGVEMIREEFSWVYFDRYN